MRQWIWTCVVVLVVAGCNTPPEVKLEIACTTICQCVSPFVDTCVDSCVDDNNPQLIADDCFECIQLHAMQCSTLEDDCEPLCEMPKPPPEGPDGGMI